MDEINGIIKTSPPSSPDRLSLFPTKGLGFRHQIQWPDILGEHEGKLESLEAKQYKANHGNLIKGTSQFPRVTRTGTMESPGGCPFAAINLHLKRRNCFPLSGRATACPPHYSVSFPWLSTDPVCVLSLPTLLLCWGCFLAILSPFGGVNEMEKKILEGALEEVLDEDQ